MAMCAAFNELSYRDIIGVLCNFLFLVLYPALIKKKKSQAF